ncbi:MAG: PHP domain-containing protein, partial [Aestuariivirga sp.]
MSAYAEIAVTTNYSFLRGASHPKELVQTAAELGLAAIGIADRNTLAGVVRAYAAHQEIKSDKPKLLVGARLVFIDSTPDILAYPTDRAAYGNLCRLLSAGKRHAPKGECYLSFDDLLNWQKGLLLVVMPSHPDMPQSAIEIANNFWNKKNSVDDKTEIGISDTDLKPRLKILNNVAPSRIWLGVSMSHHGDDQKRLTFFRQLSDITSVPLLAINDVLYHCPERRELHDVVTCIREHTTLNEAGRLLEANAERHLKSPVEMVNLFHEAPEAIAETIRFASLINFTLNQLKYNYPEEPVPKGKTAQQHLTDLTWQGAKSCYAGVIPDKIREALEKELKLINEMEIAAYFLTVHDIVSFAKDQNILCQGRGSAANSAVCYVLGITAVDPMQIDLLF